MTRKLTVHHWGDGFRSTHSAFDSRAANPAHAAREPNGRFSSPGCEVLVMNVFFFIETSDNDRMIKMRLK